MTTDARQSPPERAPRRPILPWVVWAAAALEAALIVAAPVLFPPLFAATTPGENVQLAAFLVTLAFVVMVFATAGLLVTRPQPGNAVGWLMLAGGPTLGAVFVGYVLGVALTTTDPATAAWFVLLGVVLFGPALYLLGPGLAAVFPTGRPLPGWWSWAAWLSATAVLIGTVMAALAPGPLEESITLANPLGIAALPAELRDVGNGLTALALVGGTLVAVASLVVRYVHSGSETRHQLKWFLFALITWAVVLPFSLVVADTWTATIALLVLGLVPAAVVVAVRRYRLYEIDILINRTLVYVPLVGIVAGLYAGLLALLQRLFTAATGDTSDAAAIISALALAAVFTPIRNTIQSAVDRRFKPDDGKSPSQWDDPAFRAAVEAIVRDVTGRRGGA